MQQDYAEDQWANTPAQINPGRAGSSAQELWNEVNRLTHQFESLTGDPTTSSNKTAELLAQDETYQSLKKLDAGTGAYAADLAKIEVSARTQVNQALAGG